MVAIRQDEAVETLKSIFGRMGAHSFEHFSREALGSPSSTDGPSFVLELAGREVRKAGDPTYALSDALIGLDVELDLLAERQPNAREFFLPTNRVVRDAPPRWCDPARCTAPEA